MFNLLSIMIYIINSIFSGIYTIQFLKCKQNKKTTVLLWAITYFIAQVILFEVIQRRYPFNDVVSTIVNVLLFLGMQCIFFRKGEKVQLFVCFSFVAGREIVRYIVIVLNIAIGTFLGDWINFLIMQGKIITSTQVEIANSIMTYALLTVSAILYGMILGAYLLLINKKYVRKEYRLKVQENIFLILPSIAAVCISITLKMMIVIVENGAMVIFDTVPATMFWIPLICILLLSTVIANVILFQNVVQYHEENRKRTLLENQIQQMQKEVQEIQDIYSDMRGLRHDLRGHIGNVIQYVKKQNNEQDEELNGYIRNMEDTVNRLDFGYQTGNPITDIMIHQKKQDAARAGIKFSVDFNYPKELSIDVYDIGVVLNNALENAIEAASLMESNGYVLLQSYVKGNLFFIEIENNFVNNIAMNVVNGLPESSKANKEVHGMGLTNIQRCARKYKGDIDIVIDTSKQMGQIFSLTVMLNGKPAD